MALDAHAVVVGSSPPAVLDALVVVIRLSPIAVVTKLWVAIVELSPIVVAAEHRTTARFPAPPPVAKELLATDIEESISIEVLTPEL
jgi:hypothetical protein